MHFAAWGMPRLGHNIFFLVVLYNHSPGRPNVHCMTYTVHQAYLHSILVTTHPLFSPSGWMRRLVWRGCWRKCLLSTFSHDIATWLSQITWAGAQSCITQGLINILINWCTCCTFFRTSSAFKPTIAREVFSLLQHWLIPSSHSRFIKFSAMSGYSDNMGYGDDCGHGYHKSSLRKEEVRTQLLLQ